MAEGDRVVASSTYIPAPEPLSIGSVNEADLQKIVPPSLRKTGWLNKKGQMRRNWKKRYFVLEGSTLNYFEKEPSSKDPSPKSLGEVELTHALIGRVNASSDETPGKRDFRFSIRVAGRNLELTTEAAQERDTWIAALSLGTMVGTLYSPAKQEDPRKSRAASRGRAIPPTPNTVSALPISQSPGLASSTGSNSPIGAAASVGSDEDDEVGEAEEDDAFVEALEEQKKRNSMILLRGKSGEPANDAVAELMQQLAANPPPKPAWAGPLRTAPAAPTSPEPKESSPEPAPPVDMPPVTPEDEKRAVKPPKPTRPDGVKSPQREEPIAVRRAPAKEPAKDPGRRSLATLPATPGTTAAPTAGSRTSATKVAPPMPPPRGTAPKPEETSEPAATPEAAPETGSHTGTLKRKGTQSNAKRPEPVVEDTLKTSPENTPRPLSRSNSKNELDGGKKEYTGNRPRIDTAEMRKIDAEVAQNVQDLLKQPNPEPVAPAKPGLFKRRPSADNIHAPPDTPTQNAPLKQGWLEKKSKTLQMWRKRWFVVKETSMGQCTAFYYDKDMTTQKGTISFSQKLVISPVTGNNEKDKFAFLIKVENGQNILLRAETAEERQGWIDFVQTRQGSLSAAIEWTEELEQAFAEVTNEPLSDNEDATPHHKRVGTMRSRQPRLSTKFEDDESEPTGSFSIRTNDVMDDETAAALVEENRALRSQLSAAKAELAKQQSDWIEYYDENTHRMAYYNRNTHERSTSRMATARSGGTAATRTAWEMALMQELMREKAARLALEEELAALRAERKR